LISADARQCHHQLIVDFIRELHMSHDNLTFTNQDGTERRSFLKSATLLVSTAGVGAAANEANAQTVDKTTPGMGLPKASTSVPPLKHDGPMTRRWVEQRWVLDNIIRANGIDWDQPRSLLYNAPCGPEANADFAAIRARVTKYADITPAFEAQAKRRENLGKESEQEGDPISARQHYFIAAVHWAASQWTFDTNSEHNRRNNERKRACYLKYAQYADHKVVAAWVPLSNGQKLAGWFHLPKNSSSGKVPCIVAIPGMDGFKETGVALYGDRYLERGIAVLVLEGPGQYESAVMGVHVSMQAWKETGTAALAWLAQQPEVDLNRVGMTGSSFGSFFATIAASYEPRIKAVAVGSTCLEPGCHTIFEEASPTFKMRFMYMSGMTDENQFDQFRQTLTWVGHAERLKVPYLCVAGGSDELSPMIHTERLMNTLGGPKQLLVYQDSRHSVGNVPSTNLGPNPGIYTAQWMSARLNGKPMLSSEHWFIDANGRIEKTEMGAYLKSVDLG